MIDTELREIISETYPDTILFDDPSFDRSIVGISTNGEAIYDLDKMVEELSKEDHIDYEEALEFIEFNTMRAIPYISGLKPIIIDCDATNCEIKSKNCQKTVDK